MILYSIYILWFTIGFLFIVALMMTVKYFKISRGLQEYLEIGTGRIGFFSQNENGYLYTIHIKEIDRYNNGYSKIIIDHIEGDTNITSYKKNVQSINNYFKSIKPTEDIMWLECENHLANVRKEKLQNLNIKKKK